jgi:hypothetical protein
MLMHDNVSSAITSDDFKKVIRSFSGKVIQRSQIIRERQMR